MPRYAGFSLTIESELELPELPLAASPADTPADITIALGPVAPVFAPATLTEELAINATAGVFRIRNGNEITVDPRPGVEPATLRVVLLGRVMAFLMRQRGWLPLHASAVVMGGRAVLFMGESGAGKSTTAAILHERGHRVIADDLGAVRIEQSAHQAQRCIVQPAWSRLRLFDDSKALLTSTPLEPEFQIDKHSVPLSSEPVRDHVAVHRIYMLQYGDTMHSEPLSRLESAAALSGNSFVRHARVNRDVLESHLRACADLARVMPVHRLTRPRSLPDIARMAGFIEADHAR